MTRPPDPRGAPRRGPTAFGDEIGYDIPNSVDDRPARLPHSPKPPPPQIQPGVREWWYGGTLMCRCDAHAPLGARMASATSTARCVTCVVLGAAEEVDALGNFAFSDLSSGEYELVLVTDREQVVVETILV